jgi:hypothetical protein
MAKKGELYVRPNNKRSGVKFTEVELNKKNNNIDGILMALRYLSLEAEGAGLTELANTLEEAVLKWDRTMPKILSNS